MAKIKTDNPNLIYYRDHKTVNDLIQLDKVEISDGLKERHHLYSLLLMSIVHFYWNGNKYGKNGSYPMNPTNYPKQHEDYIGHNIAAIAVDAYGAIIDFEFNHNKLFNSSVEHAEARLVKRIYGLTQINESWKTNLDNTQPLNDYNSFEDVTIYTSLESCAQCSGIMALARVKEIIYLQTDPGMYLIGNILRNLTKAKDGKKQLNQGKMESPLPISADLFDFNYFDKLNKSYKKFIKEVSISNPFFIPDSGDINKIKYDPSITSFLCTDTAYDIFLTARLEFETIIKTRKLINEQYQPLDRNGNIIKHAKTNLEVVDEISSFYKYATEFGKRGTPH
ncbi:MAG: hypothetical protein U0U67_17280 [Chitinophagales bacterium]